MALLVRVWASRDTALQRIIFRAVSEQFQSSFRAVFQSIFRTVSEYFQSIFRAVLELFQSSFRVFSEHFQSSFRAVSEQFQCSVLLLTITNFLRLSQSISISVHLIGIGVRFELIWFVDRMLRFSLSHSPPSVLFVPVTGTEIDSLFDS